MRALLSLIEVSGLCTCSPSSGFLWNGTGENWKQFIYSLLSMCGMMVFSLFICNRLAHSSAIKRPFCKQLTQQLPAWKIQSELSSYGAGPQWIIVNDIDVCTWDRKLYIHSECNKMYHILTHLLTSICFRHWQSIDVIRQTFFIHVPFNHRMEMRMAPTVHMWSVICSMSRRVCIYTEARTLASV